MEKVWMGRALLCASMLILDVTAFAASAMADDRAACHEQGASAEMAISGCSRLISSGKFKGHDLAVEYNRRGFLYENKGEHDRAIADFNEAVRLDPNFAIAYNNLGWAYNGKGEYDRAIPELHRAIQLNPNLTLAFTNRAVAYNGKNDYDRAIADLDQAIRLDPRNAVAYNRRGLSYERKGEHDRAIADFNEAIRLDPKFAVAHNNLGWVYNNKGEYDHAIPELDRAIQLNPKLALAFNNRGVSYNGKGDYNRAIADLDQAIRLNPKDARALWNRGLARIGTSDFDQAIADSDEAIRLNPTDATGYSNRCFALTRKGDFDRAIASCNQAIQLNPKLANAFASRCTAWLESGDQERALADCDEAVRLNPDYAAGYTNRGMVFERKGERDKAIADFRSALGRPQRSISGRWAQDEARKRLSPLAEGKDPAQSQPGSKPEEDANATLPKMPPLNPDRRFALLLGNANYPDADAPLAHPIRDARDLAAELRRARFIVDVQENIGKNKMRTTIDAFVSKIPTGSAVLFFYAGHGIQVGRQTYLIPVDAQIWREEDVRRDGIDIESILTRMNERRAIVKLVVIDASRRNPFERRFRGYSAGLAAVNVPDGTAIIYSATPGQVADENDGQNGLLVAELLKGIGASDLSVLEVLNRARIGVSRASGGAQVPWMSTTLIDEFYFTRANTTSSPAAARSKIR